MTIDLDKLEALARAATPGPWEDLSNHPDHLRGTINKGEKHIAGCSWLETWREEQHVSVEEALANAAFIAAANPAVVLELIEELRAKNDLLEEVFDDCGGKINDECPVCHIYTHKHWCWYPHLAKMLGKPLDEYDARFLAEKQKWATSN